MKTRLEIRTLRLHFLRLDTELKKFGRTLCKFHRNVPGFIDKVRKNIYFCTNKYVSTVHSCIFDRKSPIWKT